MWARHFVILGSPSIKKNSKRFIRNRSTGQPMLISSQQALKAEKDGLVQLKFQKRWETIKDPIHAQFCFFVPDLRKRDLSNLFEAPQDLLQKSGIISDDSLIRSLDGSRIFLDRKNPRTEITLKPFQEEIHDGLHREEEEESS